MEETIEAVRKLAELVPRMNITGDARLDALANTLATSLAGVSADKVKTQPDVRERAAEATKNAFNVLNAFRAASNGADETARLMAA